MSRGWSELLEADLRDISMAMSSVDASSEALVPGERREVAVLFLDLHGFTALSEELDHETVHRLSSSIMKALSRTVQALGGYIDKYEGDRLMALFGAVRAHSDDCVRAVSAGIRLLEIVREIGGILMDRDLTISARVGISYGPVTVAPDPSGHLTASGDCVNIASRMESSAEVGTVQVTREVMERCGELFNWMDLGERKVKGRRQPVHSFRPGGRSKAGSGRCIGPASAAWEFVDRVEELELIGERLAGPCPVVILMGFDGSGKTRLLLEAARMEMSRDGSTILFADVSSYGQRPFQMWINALDSEDVSIDELDLGPDEMDCLTELMGGSRWSRTEDISSAELRKFRSAVLVRSVLSLREKLGRGLLLIADDVHMADSGSLEVLKELAAAGSIRILASSIPGERIEISEETLTDFLGELAGIVEIEPLDPIGTRDLVRSMLSVEVTGISEDLLEPLAGRIHSRSAGIPFITVETVKLLMDRGILLCDGGRWSMAPGEWEATVPDSVRGLVRCRIDALAGDERRLLQIASVIGLRFDADVLEEAAADLTPGISGSLNGTVSSVMAEGVLIRPKGTPATILEFINPLFREMSSSTLLRQNRISIHRTVASLLEDRHGSAPGPFAREIAVHRYASGDAAKAFETGLAALDYLSEHYQNEEFLTFCSELEEWIPDLPHCDREFSHLDILMRRQKVQYLLGQFDEMEHTLERQLEIVTARGMDGELGKTYCSLGELGRMRGNTGVAKEYLDRSIEFSRKAGDLNTLGMALSNLGATLHAEGDDSRAMDCFREAISAQEECGNIRSAGIAMLNLSAILRTTGSTAESREVLERAMLNFRKTAFKSGEASALMNLALLLEAEGREDQAMDMMERAVELNRETGHRIVLASSLCLLARLLADTDQERSTEAAREALELSEETGHCGIRLEALIELAGVLASSGRIGEAVQAFRSAAALTGSDGQAATADSLKRLSDLRSRLLGSGCPDTDLPVVQ